MSEIKNGGSAFPVSPYSTDARHWSDGSEGMTLRDYFAAKAMVGELAAQDARHDGKGTGVVTSDGMLEFAGRCYALADAMLEARQNTNTQGA